MEKMFDFTMLYLTAVLYMSWLAKPEVVYPVRETG